MWRTDVLFVFPDIDNGEFRLGWEHRTAAIRIDHDIAFQKSYALRDCGDGKIARMCADSEAALARVLEWMKTCDPGDANFEQQTIYCLKSGSWTGELMSFVDGRVTYIGTNIAGDPIVSSDWRDNNYCGYLNEDSYDQ